MINRIFTSTNGTLNVVLLIILAAAALFGFQENQIENFLAVLIPFIGTIREWLKSSPAPKWNMNVFTYLSAAVIMLLPWLDELMPALGSLIDAISSMSLDKILPALLVVINIVYHIIKEKLWKAPATAIR